MLKALPLAYNKDMQEDKEAIFDSIDTVKLCLSVFAKMLDTTKVKKEVMKNAASGGFTNATDCADYLTKKGMPFRDAYKIIGGLVQYCIGKKCAIEQLSLDELKQFSQLFDNDIYTAISLETCVNERKVYGGPSKSSVEGQIEYLNKFLTDKKIGGKAL
jgi:argininosuccinate lyase